MTSIAQATASVKTTFTRQHAGQALRELRQTTRPDSAERNALNRAALNCEACAWTFDHGRLSIDSATGDRVYHVDADGCTCKAAAAGRTCWHAWAYAIIARAEEIATPKQRPPLTEADYLAVLAAVDELY